MRVAIVKETLPGERRVAGVPETVRKLVGAGVSVSVQSGAGLGAYIADDAYVDAGAEIVADRTSLLADADVVVTVQPLSEGDVGVLREGAVLIGFLMPALRGAVVRALVDRRVTAFAMDLVPRTSRAQSMDALSSQALVGGYRATLIGAERLPRFLPMFTTAAGTVPPAKVLVLGAGVAGLQAIATARRLGAVVDAHDVRAASAEEVRSLGATFIDLGLETQEGAGGYAREQSTDFVRRQRELLDARVPEYDLVITTAAVPGRPAPVLVTKDMVEGMRPGSVVVDLAADSGGNCELSRAGEDVVHGGVTVVGMRNAPSDLPVHASQLFARNVLNLLMLMVKDGSLAPDFGDDILAGCCATRDGSLVHPAAQQAAETGGTP